MVEPTREPSPTASGGYTDQTDNMGQDQQLLRKRRRGLLRMYYGVDDAAQSRKQEDVLDINNTHFKANEYLDQLYKTCDLQHLKAEKEKTKSEIRELDGDMQRLVYENYSKFIKATDMIREMKSDFHRMEDEMSLLSGKMQEIMSASTSINSALANRRQQIAKLSGVHHLLKKLQFLFELPARLKKCIEMKAYSQAVRYYSKACGVLEMYQHMPSFQDIQKDCTEIISELRVILKNLLNDPKASARTVAETVDLLLQLKEPEQELYEQYLSNATRRLQEDLVAVKDCEMDVTEFVRLAHSSFLSNLQLLIGSFSELFIKQAQSSSVAPVAGNNSEVAAQSLTDSVQELLASFMDNARSRLEHEARSPETAPMVKVLDKIYCKLEAVHSLLPSAGINRQGRMLVNYIVKLHAEYHSEQLRKGFEDALLGVRQSLVTAKISSMPTTNELCNSLYSALKASVDKATNQLKEVIKPDVNFSQRSFTEFREDFCVKNVRQGMVVALLEFVLDTASNYTEASYDRSASHPPPSLVLILSKLSHDLSSSGIAQMVNVTDERFPLTEFGHPVKTDTSTLLSKARRTAQVLLNHYVKVQGLVVAQMIRKSVETRDWLNSLEPRNVRAVMKRVVEEVTIIDKQVGLLYIEGTKKEQGSEGSRHTYSHTQRMSYSVTASGYDSSFMSNIQKLFTERIEVFSSVDFSKISIVTGIIKITLKALLECVRMRTFGKFGLQQMQVDVHYLQTYLWRFVSDERVVRMLLDEVVSSTVQRCIDPALMEPKVIEVICERS